MSPLAELLCVDATALDLDQLDQALEGFNRVRLILQGAMEANDEHRDLVFVAAFSAYGEAVGKLARTLRRLNWRREAARERRRRKHR